MKLCHNCQFKIYSKLERFTALNFIFIEKKLSVFTENKHTYISNFKQPSNKNNLLFLLRYYKIMATR